MARPAGGAIDLTRGVAGVRCGKLNINRAQFGRLAGAAQWRLTTSQLKGRVRFDWREAGLVCEITLRV